MLKMRTIKGNFVYINETDILAVEEAPGMIGVRNIYLIGFMFPIRVESVEEVLGSVKNILK